MTHEELIMFHDTDIKKCREMLRNTTIDLGKIYERLDRLEAQMAIQIKMNEDMLELLRGAYNG